MRALAITLALAACSSSSPASVTDAAIPLPDGADPSLAIRCDVVAQTCPAGKRCDFICENGVLVIDCIAPVANPAMAGDSCGGSDAGASTGSSCGTGTGCFGSTSKGPTCYRYCNAGSTCPAGTKCDTTTKFHAACTRTGGNLPVGLCR